MEFSMDLDELTMECPICDRNIPITSRKCPHCGTEFSTGEIDELEELAINLSKRSFEEPMEPPINELMAEEVPPLEPETFGSETVDAGESVEWIEAPPENSSKEELKAQRKEEKREKKKEFRKQKKIYKTEKRESKAQRKEEKREKKKASNDAGPEDRPN